QLVADREEKRALRSACAGELSGHRVERLGETAELARSRERERFGLIAFGQSVARACDPEDRARDAAREHRADCCRQQAAEAARGGARHPEWPALRTYGARRAEKDVDAATAR